MKILLSSVLFACICASVVVADDDIVLGDVDTYENWAGDAWGDSPGEGVHAEESCESPSPHSCASGDNSLQEDDHYASLILASYTGATHYIGSEEYWFRGRSVHAINGKSDNGSDEANTRSWARGVTLTDFECDEAGTLSYSFYFGVSSTYTPYNFIWSLDGTPKIKVWCGDSFCQAEYVYFLDKWHMTGSYEKVGVGTTAIDEYITGWDGLDGKTYECEETVSQDEVINVYADSNYSNFYIDFATTGTGISDTIHMSGNVIVKEDIE